MSSYSKRYIDNILNVLRDKVSEDRSSSSMDYHINMLRDISIPSSVKHNVNVNQVKHDDSVKQSGSGGQARPPTFIEILLGKKRAMEKESVKVESRKKKKEYKVLRVSDVVKILYEYYVLGRKQKDISNRYGISQSTVSYYVTKYRRYVYDVIDKCKGDIANYAECFNKNLRDIVLANHRKRKRKSRKKRKSS